MKQLSDCLMRHGAYLFKTTELAFAGMTSPYIVRDPVPRPKEYLKELGIASVELPLFNSQCDICLIGIANSGLGLVHAISSALNDYGKTARVIEIDPRTEVVNGFLPTLFEKTVLVDNAVTKGDTLLKVSKSLGARGVKAKYAVRVFDREDVGINGITTCELIKNSLDIQLFSIFSIRDLLPQLPKQEREIITEYLFDHGSESVKKYLRQKERSHESSS